MKPVLLTCLFLLLATPILAGPIIDLQTGGYTEGDEVIVPNAVVTGVGLNGLFICEDPNGPFAGVWVYTGFAPAVATGDLVAVKGLYLEYYDFSEIDVASDATGYINYLGVYNNDVVAIDVTIADLVYNTELYEGCFVRVLDNITVISAPNSYGEWEVQGSSGEVLIMDDYWYDTSTIIVGDSYSQAVGCMTYSFGDFKLEPFENGLGFQEDPVATDEVSFGQIKSLYR